VVVTAGPESVEAILPADAPLGPANLSISYCAQTSAVFPITVAQASPGLYSANGEGWGPAQTGGSGPLRRGQAAALLGTGFGRVTDPVQIFVGGIAARDVRRTRGNAPGLDVIRFPVPADAPEGCYVPVQARIGRIVSNTVTLAIASGACSDAHNWMAAQSQVQRGGFAILAHVVARISGAQSPLALDAGLASFTAAAQSRAIHPLLMLPPIGACAASAGRTQGFSLPPALAEWGGAGLDAGEIFLRSPAGLVRTLAKLASRPGTYAGWLGSEGLPPFITQTRFAPLPAGPYEFSGQGGKDVGPFRAAVTLRQPVHSIAPEVVDRSHDLEVHWENGSPEELALILAFGMDRATGTYGVAVCPANAGSGQITIPAIALANIPATPSEEALPAGLIVAATIPAKAPQAAPAPGLDRFTAIGAAASAASVKFR